MAEERNPWERRVPNEATVIEAINNAVVENHYEDLPTWTDEDIATDLWLYMDEVDCEPNDPELLAHVKAWRRQWEARPQ